MDPWPSIKADRETFADYLGALSPEQWDAPSWCEGWTVKGVATHLLATPTLSKGQMFVAFAGSGFNLHRMSAKLIARMTSALSTEEIVVKTRATAGATSAPPGLNPMGVFGEVLVHTNDVAGALGMPLDLPIEDYVEGLEHLKGVQPFLGCKKRVEGLRLQATDANWSSGDGPLVEGDAKSLLSAITGRRPAFDALTGDGVATMRAR
jgi:uncharacterized protein (TIGR03083 family)